MTVNEIMKLLDAGYTKEEISALEAPAPEAKPEPVPAPEAKPEPVPAPEAKPEAKPDAKAEPTPAPEAKPEAEPTLADVLKQMAKLTATIQANALAETRINGQPKAPTAEDMIAQIIRPTRKERET